VLAMRVRRRELHRHGWGQLLRDGPGSPSAPPASRPCLHPSWVRPPPTRIVSPAGRGTARLARRLAPPSCRALALPPGPT